MVPLYYMWWLKRGGSTVLHVAPERGGSTVLHVAAEKGWFHCITCGG